MTAMPAIRVTRPTYERIRTIANERNEPMSAVIAELVDAYERRAFFAGLDEDFAALRADPLAWDVYQRETRVWDTALSDGLADEPYEDTDRVR